MGNCQKVRTCTKCKRSLPETKEYFHEGKRNKGGLRPICIECKRKDDREWSKVHRKEVYLRRRDKCLAEMKDYREKNKDKLKEYSRKHYAENKDAVKAYQEVNQERIAQRMRVWRQEKIEHRRDYKRTHRVDNSIIAHRRNARIRCLPNSFAASDWEYCMDYFNNSCAYCGATENLTQDHFVPVFNGGGYTRDNVVPACMPCNSSKRDRNFDEWYKKKKFYSEDRQCKIGDYFDSMATEEMGVIARA